MLEYENSFFLDLHHEDGLLVLGKGLGLENIFLNFLKVYSDPGNLVLVLGTSDLEEEYFTRELKNYASMKPEKESRPPPKKITSEFGVNERKKVYLDGGVLFMSSRILTVDLLTDRIPVSLITGILLYRAHKTADSGQEAFILRLYRQKNSTGFIKAFSDSPAALSSGFSKVNRIMRILFLKNLYLGPRFHSNVISTFEKKKPEVIELHITMTNQMITLQTAIMDLIFFVLSELKRLNPHLSGIESLSAENAVTKSFYKNLSRECDPVWHQLSFKSKTLISDLKTLKSLLSHLTLYDCVTFHETVSALRTTENAIKTGGWMLQDSAETLFVSSESRIFTGSSKKQGPDATIEESPKWNGLKQIIKEIQDSVPKETFPSHKILVITSDFRTASQLEEVLNQNPQVALKKLFNKCSTLTEKFGTLNILESNNKTESKKSEHVTLTQMYGVEEERLLTPLKGTITLIQSLQKDAFEVFRILKEIQPRYIILYDADVTTVRRIEAYAASVEFGIRVYFMFYVKSVEEQAYLSDLKVEKDAFEILIKEKTSMVIPDDRDGREGRNEDLIRSSQKASDAIVAGTSSSRAGGGAFNLEKNAKIIVDMREFRCELPSLIHKRGIDIEPLTIEVGDYVLTPEIVIERKSIPDLVGSLNSGRLYNQATAMFRFYKTPMLLIEFDSNKPFSLQGKYYMSRDLNSGEFLAKLQLLTLNFPKLILLWSPGPHASAELFEELKSGRDEPSSSAAVGMTMDVVDEFDDGKYNPAIQDFLLKLPGVNSANVYSIMNKLKNMEQLFALSTEELIAILDNSINGELLYRALHTTLEPVKHKESENSSKGSSRFRKRKL